jgi:cyanuric acid amidohydrolase
VAGESTPRSRRAGIENPADAHLVQIKTGALTTERINDARGRGRTVVTGDTYTWMIYGRPTR